MLLNIPFKMADELLKYGSATKILKALSSGQLMTAASIMREVRLSWKAVWSALQALVKTEYVTREGRMYRATEKVRENSFLLNLRDSLTDELLRWKSARHILYLLYTRPECSLLEISDASNLPYPTVRAVVKRLRRIGLIAGKKISSELIMEPSDQLELVPRIAHRRALRHFLSTLKTYYPKFDEAIILFGDASWGKLVITLDLAVIVEKPEPEWMLYIAKKLVYSSKNVTADLGVIINLTMMARYVLPQINLDIVEYASPLPRMVANGICIYGQLPRSEDLFELGGYLNPRPEEEIRRLLRKGYIQRIEGDRYVYTEKAIERFRKNKSRVTENLIRIDDKEMRLIGVAPPSRIS